ncbi:MAG: 8-amino-7-oxononanoate synthase [Candidatus Omnitrophota bacterium]|nr:8-amino-7-oxononanoate synthase [Candidatus Omnitrophota bacterium]MDZ4242714.1 8-amino-7-oxononanoate synthase [Candidatus Omnitrophota bacterium]
MSKEVFFGNDIAALEQQQLRRRMRDVEGPQGRAIVLNGREVLNFCSNNYLGLADDPRLIRAAAECMEKEGFGSGASRLVCGNMASHRRLEEKIAAFKGAPAALVFSSGYMANVGIISSLMGRDDVVFSDRLNHASIIDGILLSQAKLKRYPHSDMDALEGMLREPSSAKRKLIVTDSVFSMDGDIAPLDRIAALAERYGCMMMVDEAHAFGVLGKNGKGAVEHFGLEGRVDIQMGTFSKAAGSFGAYGCGSETLIEYLVNHARSFIYTTGMPPAVAAASQAAIEIMEHEPDRRETLWDNARYLGGRLKELGFDIGRTRTPIIPIIVRDSGLAVEFSRRLLEAGIFVSAIRPPTVPANTARLRVTVMATHTREDLDRLTEQLKNTGRALCLI